MKSKDNQESPFAAFDTAAATAAAALDAAADQISGAVAPLETAHATKVEERRRLLELPPPPDAIVANMRRLVDAQSERFQAESRGELVQSCSGGYESRLQRIDDFEVAVVHDQRAPQLPDALLYHDLKSWQVVALLAEVIKPKLEAIIRSEPYKYGPPMAERPALLEQLDREIRAIGDRHEALVEAAVKRSIPITHLPAVLVRRLAADRRAEAQERVREAQAEQERQRQQLEALGLPTQARREVGRSQYIESGTATP